MYVRIVYSNDSKTFVIHGKCIASVCYTSANTKTYYPDLPDMRGMFVLYDKRYIIYTNRTVSEYEPLTNKVKQIVTGLNSCNMCLPCKDTNTSKQSNLIIDYNKREDNIKLYSDRWNLIHSFGPHGSQDGMLDGPQLNMMLIKSNIICTK